MQLHPSLVQADEENQIRYRSNAAQRSLRPLIAQKIPNLTSGICKASQRLEGSLYGVDSIATLHVSDDMSETIDCPVDSLNIAF